LNLHNIFPFKSLMGNNLSRLKTGQAVIDGVFREAEDMKKSGKHIQWFFATGVVFLFYGCMILSPRLVMGQEPSNHFEKAIFIDAMGLELTSHAAAEKGFQKILKAGFDTLYIHTRYLGEVFYTSIMEPRSNRIELSYPDPLNDFIMMGHASSLESPLKIFAWLSIFPAHSGEISKIPPPGNIMQKHPEWMTENYDGEKADRNMIYHLDPGVPAVQNYIVAMTMELVEKYDVDGILIDNFRYPDDGLNWGYNQAALAAYYKDTGLSEKPLPYDPRFSEWRRKQLTNLLEKIQQGVKARKPQLKIYVQGIAWSSPGSWKGEFKNSPAYSLVFQDWIGWMEKRLVDGVVVGNYKQFPHQKEEFNDWINFLLSHKEKGSFICAIGGFFNFAEGILNQMKTVRKSGLYGIALYCYRLPSQGNTNLLFEILPTTVFSPQMSEFRRSGIALELTPTPTPEPVVSVETSPTLALSLPTTETLALTPVPTPSPNPGFIPAAPGLPSLPNLEELITPTPVITEIPPQMGPGELISKQPKPGAEKSRPGIGLATATPTPKSSPTLSQFIKPQWDTIYLKNGSSITGRVLEEVEEKVTIESSKGFIMTLPISDIEKVVKYR